MAEGFRADYTELAHLAGEVLDAADGLSAAARASQSRLAVSSGAFGNSTAGSAVADAHLGVAEQAGSTTGRLVEVLEGDVDRLYRVAFAYRKIDEEHAAQLCRHRPTGGPTPC